MLNTTDFSTNFRGKWNIYARCGFLLLGQFSPIEIIVFNNIFYIPLKELTSSVQNQKDISPPIIFCKVLDGLKIAKLAIF